MNKSLFLVKFKENIELLTTYRTNLEVDILKSFVLANVEHIEESDLAMDFINMLIEISERPFIQDELDQFILISSRYWFSLLQSAHIKFVFFGDEENYLTLKAFIAGTRRLSLEWMPLEDADKLSSSTSSDVLIIIYDNNGVDVLQREFDVLAKINMDYFYYDANSLSEANLGYLEAEYQKLKQPEGYNQLMLGNSHAWYAMPACLSENTVNLAMHSADLSYINAMVAHALQFKKVDLFFITLSPFDLYIELSKSTGTFNRYVFNTLLAFTQRNGIEYITQCESPTETARCAKGSVVTDNLIDIAINLADPLRELTKTKDYFSLKRAFSANPAYELQSCDNYIESYDEYSNAAASRGKAHASLKKRCDSVEINKMHIKNIACMIEDNDKKLIIIFPPYPSSYINQFPQEMLNELQDYVKELLKGNNIKLLDYSTDKDFNARDFRDGDHLNVHGAQKLMAKLAAEEVKV